MDLRFQPAASSTPFRERTNSLDAKSSASKPPVAAQVQLLPLSSSDLPSPSPKLEFFSCHEFSLALNYSAFAPPSEVLCTVPLADGSNRQTERLQGCGTVLKKGTDVLAAEGLALVHAQSLGVRVPEASYVRSISAHRGLLFPPAQFYGFDLCMGKGFLFVQDVGGEQLHKIWPNLDSSVRTSLVSEIVSQLDLLRPSTAPYIGDFGGGPATRLSTTAARCFKRAREYRAAVEQCCVASDAPLPFLVEASRAIDEFDARRPAPSAYRLYHGDLAARNILVTPAGQLSGIVDWGCAAFLPDGLDWAVVYLERERLGGQGGNRELLGAVLRRATPEEKEAGRLYVRWMEGLEQMHWERYERERAERQAQRPAAQDQ